MKRVSLSIWLHKKRYMLEWLPWGTCSVSPALQSISFMDSATSSSESMNRKTTTQRIPMFCTDVGHIPLLMEFLIRWYFRTAVFDHTRKITDAESRSSSISRIWSPETAFLASAILQFWGGILSGAALSKCLDACWTSLSAKQKHRRGERPARLTRTYDVTKRTYLE